MAAKLVLTHSHFCHVFCIKGARTPLLRPGAQREGHRESTAVTPSLSAVSLKSKSEYQECLTEQSVITKGMGVQHCCFYFFTLFQEGRLE